jgi:uncharacterized protein
MNWRVFNRGLHRDIGYLCIGLTLVYALSGIAVNHLRDWNPNYKVVRTAAQIAPTDFRGVLSEAMVLDLLRQLGERATYDNIFQPDPESLMVFVEGRVIEFHLPSGTVEYERVAPRFFWHPLNFIHLNHPKKAWTWIADLYAVGLILLSLTGLLLLPRGRLRPRCLVLAALGLLLPFLPLLLYY